jgi:hypothetical protein
MAMFVHLRGHSMMTIVNQAQRDVRSGLRIAYLVLDVFRNLKRTLRDRLPMSSLERVLVPSRF